MLDQQDINQIREVVREEISGTDKKISILETRISKIEEKVTPLQKNVSSLEQNVSSLEQNVSSLEQNVSSLEQNVSSLEQNVSSLEQNVSTLQQDFRHFGVLMEDQTKLIKLVLENVTQNNKYTEKVPFIEDTLANHEIRIKGLEFAKKKSA